VILMARPSGLFTQNSPGPSTSFFSKSAKCG
jgi:hypothetical protein